MGKSKRGMEQVLSYLGISRAGALAGGRASISICKGHTVTWAKIPQNGGCALAREQGLTKLKNAVWSSLRDTGVVT